MRRAPCCVDVLRHDLANEYRDAEWMFSMALLAAPVAAVGDADAAAAVYGLLEPFAHAYAVAPVEGVFGAVARGLGVVASALGRHDDAERHLEAAIALERRMGGRPWLAHAQHDLGAALLRRGDARPGGAPPRRRRRRLPRAGHGELGRARSRAALNRALPRRLPAAGAGVYRPGGKAPP